jgi:hypothetical protein
VLLLLGVVEVLMWVPAQQKGPKSGGRGAVALQQLRGIAVAGVLALGILWAFYGFRYAMRPAGLEARPTLAVYAHDLPAADASAIAAMARWHLLPESYLMGLADVRLVERQMPSFLLGHNYPHGVWWYFPVALSIKLTLGMLGLLALLAIALALGRPRHLVREVLYMAVPALAYLALAMRSGLNIGVRHVLPVFPFLILLVSGAAWALIRRDRRWQWPVGALLLAHAVSSLAAYPDYLAYSNVLWGGPGNTYKYLSDSNVDWGQQLISVKRFLDREPPEPCWFVYFMDPIVRPAQYGIPCRPMPTMDTAWLGMPTDVPTHVTGRVLVSAGDWSGGEWPDARLNPYLGFHSLRPAAIIDGGVLVYEGDFDMRPVAALSHAQRAQILLDENSVPLAREEARRAATDAPGDVRTELVLGKALYRAGSQAEAVRAWLRAVHNCGELNPVTAEQYLEELRGLIAGAQP